MIPRLGDGNSVAPSLESFHPRLSLENDSPSRGRKLVCGIKDLGNSGQVEV